MALRPFESNLFSVTRLRACSHDTGFVILRTNFASDRHSVHTTPMESDALHTSFPESNHYAVEVLYAGLLNGSELFSARVNR